MTPSRRKVATPPQNPDAKALMLKWFASQVPEAVLAGDWRFQVALNMVVVANVSYAAEWKAATAAQKRRGR